MPGNCFSQTNQIHSTVFNDSVLAKIFVLPAIEVDPPYTLSSRTIIWQRSRFFYEAPRQFQHHEAMNLYAYDNAAIKKLISPKQWSMLAHIALKQYSGKVKQVPENIILQSKKVISLKKTHFSITKPAIYQNIAIIDLTYYHFEAGIERKDDGYSGQALFVFQKNKDGIWVLKGVVNSVLL